MALDKTVREQAGKATKLLLNGQPINPWLVGIDFDAKSSSVQPVELRLGLPILIFELQQSEVQVNEQTILSFVEQDIKKHQHEALDVYLTIVRHIVNPPPRRKSNGWFARMFTKPPSWTPPPPRCKWTSVTQVSLHNDEALVIKGFCCDC